MTEAPRAAAVDRADRTSNPAVLALVLICLVAAVAAFIWLPGDYGHKAVSWTIAGFAVIGVFGLLTYAFGALQFAARVGRFDVAKGIADGNVDGFVVTDKHSRVLYANEVYRTMSGARDDPRAIRPVERLFTGAPEISESVYRLAQASRAGNRAVEELRLSPPLAGDGEAAWYRIRVRPLEGGEITGQTLWTVSDVTRERERHESFFQDLQHAIDYLDHAPTGFFSADPDGSIVHMNATLYSWLGYDLAQFSAKKLTLSDIIAGDGSSSLAAVSGRPGEVTTARIDVDLKPRQGRLMPVRLLHRVAFSSEGLPGSSRTIVIDGAAVGSGADDPRAAEERLTRLFNATPIAIASVDSKGLVLRSNSAFARLAPLALKAPEGASHGSIFGGVVERDQTALAAAIKTAGEGQPDIAPIDVTMSGEPARSARLFISAAEANSGDSAILFALDTTEQRTLQEGFAQGQKMQAIGQLAGGIAHDFNNVLTAIIGYSDLLLANHRPTDPSFQDIMQIKQNANRAAGLVRQLLAFSRRQTLLPQTLLLSDVLNELQMLLRRLVGEKIELEVTLARDLWFVQADLNQFEQVIVNLVVNARDAMPTGGRIVLRTRNVAADECPSFNEKSLVPAEYVLVEVQDNGHGIPPDVLDKIFEPFFTTKEVGKGTGLGLSTVYGIVKQTGGYVFCVSSPGAGASFRILLPRHIPDEAAQPAAKKDTPKAAADLTGEGAILLVEDEEAVRAFASRALASRGYTVLEAESGVDALRVVEEAGEKIDLIVSDVIMPEMDGPSMLTELRKRGMTAKIIFVSGYADDAFAKNLPEGEEFVFLQKPFSLKQLVETVKGSMS
jgi:two-component system, cell cycle sensor histidine kinase and response regulator CckA